MLQLSSTFPTLLEMIMWLLCFILPVCITLINFVVVVELYMHFTCESHLVMCCSIRLASNLLRILHQYSSRILICCFLFLLCLCLVVEQYWPHRMSLGMFSPLQFFGRIRKRLVLIAFLMFI